MEQGETIGGVGKLGVHEVPSCFASRQFWMTYPQPTNPNAKFPLKGAPAF